MGCLGKCVRHCTCCRTERQACRQCAQACLLAGRSEAHLNFRVSVRGLACSQGGQSSRVSRGASLRPCVSSRAMQCTSASTMHPTVACSPAGAANGDSAWRLSRTAHLQGWASTLGLPSHSACCSAATRALTPYRREGLQDKVLVRPASRTQHSIHIGQECPQVSELQAPASDTCCDTQTCPPAA